MQQYQISDYSFLIELLDSYRKKYHDLLTKGGSPEELTYFQSAIQYYLSVIGMIKNAEKKSNLSGFSFKSFFRKFKGWMTPRHELKVLHSH